MRSTSAFSSGRRCWACEADEVFYNGYPVERHDKRLYFLKNTTFPLIANRTATIAHLIRRLKAPPSPTGEGLLRRSFWQPTNMLQNLKLTTLPLGEGSLNSTSNKNWSLRFYWKVNAVTPENFSEMTRWIFGLDIDIATFKRYNEFKDKNHIS